MMSILRRASLDAVAQKTGDAVHIEQQLVSVSMVSDLSTLP